MIKETYMQYSQSLLSTKCFLRIFSGGLVPSEHAAGSIEFKNIVFSYPARPDSVIFDNLSLTVPMGQITAVVGSSGSGKSSLGSLLLRFYDPQKGQHQLLHHLVNLHF